jgi:serine/threonine protein kinase
LATETIIGSYRIEEIIGRGGMGVVYRGHHTKLPREVAIKSINANTNRDLRRLRHRFEREAYVQSQLDHPGIVKIYDYIVAEQTYYIVMEYVEGRSLAQVLAREMSPLPVDRALDIFEQILTAIGCAQTFVYRDQDGSMRRGLIHRDLKPANILIGPDDHVKITDFGIVKLVGSENTDTFGGAYGSPQYVSPEQAEGRQLDQRSDIYSLGIILYEMLTGKPPFDDGETSLARTEVLHAQVERAPLPPSKKNEEITPELEKAILCALEKEPGKRFETATEFLRAIRHARGRETGDLPECETEPPSRAHVGTQEIYDSTIGEHGDETARQTYVTQPIRALICGSCGADSAPDDKHCPQCGHELNASPATANLTRQDALVQESKHRAFLWIAVALFALALVAGIIYYARPASAPVAGPAVSTAESPAPTVQTPAPVPGNPSLVELKPAHVEVDSSFEGYSAAPLTDGETDVREIGRKRYNAGNWASAETPGPHWIEFSFERPVRLTAVYLYWGFDRSRFMPSRHVQLQVPDEHGEWRSISNMNPGDDYDRTAFEFAPATITRARIFQPAQQGPVNRPFVMWVREVKTFAVKDENDDRQ